MSQLAARKKKAITDKEPNFITNKADIKQCLNNFISIFQVVVYNKPIIKLYKKKLSHTAYAIFHFLLILVYALSIKYFVDSC